MTIEENSFFLCHPKLLLAETYRDRLRSTGCCVVNARECTSNSTDGLIKVTAYAHPFTSYGVLTVTIRRITLLFACLCIALPASAQEQPAQEQPAAEAPAQEAPPAEEAPADQPPAETEAQPETQPPADEKAAADKAAEEKAAADKAAEEKAAADKKAADEKMAAEKMAAEKKAADEKAAAEKMAAEEKAAEEKAAVDPGTTQGQVVLEGLNNPSGLAIQPETATLFIADSGNHKIVKVVDGKAVDVITDFPGDVYGKGPMVNIGPLGLLFLDKNTLVIGGGGLQDGEELLRVYTLPEDGQPIKADAMIASFALAAAGETLGEGNFYALAASGDGIYVTSNGDDAKGWVAKATVNGNTVSGFERYLATKEATGVDAPVGITVSPDGYLVVTQMGEIDASTDSLVTFYDAASKEMLMNVKVGLHDLTAITYSKRGQMYVLDYSWAEPTQGGLFQVLEDKAQESGVRTKKISALDKPTAMVFDASGNLFVTVIGEAADGNSQGKLIQIPASAGL